MDKHEDLSSPDFDKSLIMMARRLITPSGVSWSPCLDGSGLAAKWSQHNIRLVVIMLCLNLTE